MYCRACGAGIHASDDYCPKCGFGAKQVTRTTNPSVWMAVTAFLIAIFALLATMGALIDIENMTDKDVIYSAIGSIILTLPSFVLGALSLAEKRGLAALAISSIAASAFNCILVVLIFVV